MKSSVSAIPSTSGPITIPSISSTTTTGGANRRRQRDHRHRRERRGDDDREEGALVDGDQPARDYLGAARLAPCAPSPGLIALCACSRCRRRRRPQTAPGPLDRRLLPAGRGPELAPGGRQRLELRALAPPPEPGDPRPRPGREPDRELPHRSRRFSPTTASASSRSPTAPVRRSTRPATARRPPADAAQRPQAQALRRPGADATGARRGRRRRPLRGQPDARLVGQVPRRRRKVDDYVGITPLWDGTNLAARLARPDRPGARASPPSPTRP